MYDNDNKRTENLIVYLKSETKSLSIVITSFRRV